MLNYDEFIGFLGQTLPSPFEIILFDTTKEGLPIITCANRMTGTHDISRKLVEDILQSKELQERGAILNHPQQNKMGKMIKTSVFLVKNEENEVERAVCVNVQCDVFLQMQTLASSVLQFSMTDIHDVEQEPGKKWPAYSEPSLDMITKAVEECGVEPGRVSQNERIEIICDLYDLGVFELKGAVAKTAEVLRVSEQSVYRYLSKIKKARS